MKHTCNILGGDESVCIYLNSKELDLVLSFLWSGWSWQWRGRSRSAIFSGLWVIWLESANFLFFIGNYDAPFVILWDKGSLAFVGAEGMDTLKIFLYRFCIEISWLFYSFYNLASHLFSFFWFLFFLEDT